MKVALEQLRRGGELSLADALTMEFRLSQAYCADHDFFEGIRALIVDKDNMPDNWETRYGLDPTVDDGSRDLDGDGSRNRTCSRSTRSIARPGATSIW